MSKKEKEKKIKEIEAKAIEFFNIPKDIADNQKLKFSEKLILNFTLEEYFENGADFSEDAFDRLEKKLFEKLKMFEKEFGLNSYFPNEFKAPFIN